MRRLSRVEKFINVKTKNFIQSAFLKLRINVFQLKLKEEKEKEDKNASENTETKSPVKPVVVEQNNDRENQA